MSATRTAAFANKQPAPVASAGAPSRRAPQPVFTPTRLIQRKCACGGGCPKCEDELNSKVGVQTKLTVGAAGDSYEREADRLSEQVMRMPAPSDSPQVSQRNAALQARPVASEITPLTDSGSSSEATLHGEAAGIIEEARGGEPLPEAVRSYMEPRFGADFTQVRVHSGAQSACLNEFLHAQAFTYGGDIWLGHSESTANPSLMAHELSHVLQQRGRTSAIQRKGARNPRPESSAITVQKNPGLRWSYNIYLQKPVTYERALSMLFRDSTLPKELHLEETGITLSGWSWKLWADTHVLGPDTFVKLSPRLAAAFRDPVNLFSNTAEEGAERRAARKEALEAPRGILSGRSVLEARENCPGEANDYGCWGVRGHEIFYVGLTYTGDTTLQVSYYDSYEILKDLAWYLSHRCTEVPQPRPTICTLAEAERKETQLQNERLVSVVFSFASTLSAAAGTMGAMGKMAARQNTINELAGSPEAELSGVLPSIAPTSTAAHVAPIVSTAAALVQAAEAAFDDNDVDRDAFLALIGVTAHATGTLHSIRPGAFGNVSGSVGELTPESLTSGTGAASQLAPRPTLITGGSEDTSVASAVGGSTGPEPLITPAAPSPSRSRPLTRSSYDWGRLNRLAQTMRTSRVNLMSRLLRGLQSLTLRVSIDFGQPLARGVTGPEVGLVDPSSMGGGSGVGARSGTPVPVTPDFPVPAPASAQAPPLVKGQIPAWAVASGQPSGPDTAAVAGLPLTSGLVGGGGTFQLGPAGIPSAGALELGPAGLPASGAFFELGPAGKPAGATSIELGPAGVPAGAATVQSGASPAIVAPSAAPTPGASQAASSLRAIPGAQEITLTQAQFQLALGHVYPSWYLDQIASTIDAIAQRAAARAVANPQFVAAVQSRRWMNAGTFFHSAAAAEARALPAGDLPFGWSMSAEETVQSGRGGSRIDILLRGPNGERLEVDWKTRGYSAMSSGSLSEMQRHARQIVANIGGVLTGQESRSWIDYVRPLMPGVNWPR